jgi:cohesin complex subunit SCC1
MSASNFFNQDLLTKRGALAQVWMASHLSTKLSKQALTSTSIPKSVQSILGTQLASMAIRLSGQLLLGIARIYSRKTKYLLDDAQETLAKVKKAFQNEGRAAVDLPEDQQGAAAGEDGARGGNRDINLRREAGDFEDLLGAGFGDEEW